jgi:hypothetical protein
VSPASGCPRAEEYSALLDRQLAPQEVPELERHVGECQKCRQLFLRLAAADRMLGLVLVKVDLLGECLAVKPEKNEELGDRKREEILALGRTERLAGLRDDEERAARRLRRRRLALVLLLLLALGSLAGALQPSPVVALKGARRDGVFVEGPGEVELCRGARLRLSEGARARFWCAFRWEQPAAQLLAGRLELLEGELRVRTGTGLKAIRAGQRAERTEAGPVRIAPGTASPSGAPAPAAAPSSPPSPAP